jgi:hypothetical protein
MRGIAKAKHGIKHELDWARPRPNYEIGSGYGLRKTFPRLRPQLFHAEQQYDGKCDADSHQAEGGAPVPCAGKREGKQRLQLALPFSPLLLFVRAVPVVNFRKNGLLA